MKLYHKIGILNSEGEILSILKDENDSLFIMGITDNGRKRIITKTNHFQLSLYLQSRINLKELYLMNQDNHFYILTGKKSRAVFFEITSDNIPKEIMGLECGNDLYHLLPSGMRTIMNEQDINDLLPNPLSSEEPEEIDNTAINMAGVNFFDTEKSPVNIVSVESEIHNPDEHDYFMCPTQYGKEDILVKINPYVLFLFLHNRLSISEVYKCRMDDYYIVHDGEKFIRSKYNSFVESLLLDLGQLNLTYYSLAPKIRIETPIELYKYYINNYTISGKGILESGFKSSYPIEVKIIKNK